jgi:hypothetical protein
MTIPHDVSPFWSALVASADAPRAVAETGVCKAPAESAGSGWGRSERSEGASAPLIVLAPRRGAAPLRLHFLRKKKRRMGGSGSGDPFASPETG